MDSWLWNYDVTSHGLLGPSRRRLPTTPGPTEGRSRAGEPRPRRLWDTAGAHPLQTWLHWPGWLRPQLGTSPQETWCASVRSSSPSPLSRCQTDPTALSHARTNPVVSAADRDAHCGAGLGESAGSQFAPPDLAAVRHAHHGSSRIAARSEATAAVVSASVGGWRV